VSTDNERFRRKRILAAEIDQVLNEALLTTDVHDVVEVLAHAAVEILTRADKPDVASAYFLDCLDEAFKSMSGQPASG
jgi:hypothetical protein